MLYNDIYSCTPTGKIENDIKDFLLKYNKEITYKHSIRVANEARKIAGIFYEDEEKALIAGYLHDISAIFPNEERIAVAEVFGIEISLSEMEAEEGREEIGFWLFLSFLISTKLIFARVMGSMNGEIIL